MMLAADFAIALHALRSPQGAVYRASILITGVTGFPPNWHAMAALEPRECSPP